MAGRNQIGTRQEVRKLQRTLYQQAKKQPRWKAWSLYGELTREVIMEEAMSRILRNRGSSGIDGYTVEAMEADWERFRDRLRKELKEKTYRPSPVKRIRIPKANGGERELGIPTVKDRVVQMMLLIVIEPIFEADFHDESYGYRPKRKAADAIGSICAALYYGKTTAIEADLSSYFDTIEHRRLMKLVSRRISDGAILKLIKGMLSVPVVESAGKGKRRTIPNRKQGVPQGGVISPMLANLYLDRLDHAVNALNRRDVKMVRYADDFVILVRPGLEREVYSRVKRWLKRARLTLNENKTHLTRVAEGGRVEFLGYVIGERCSLKTGKRYIHREPSRKSQQRYRDKIREILHHWSTWRDTESVVEQVNRITRGWGNYFLPGHSPAVNHALNRWLGNRMRTWLAKKHRLRSKSKYVVFSDRWLQEHLGLLTLPQQSEWWLRERVGESPRKAGCGRTARPV